MSDDCLRMYKKVEYAVLGCIFIFLLISANVLAQDYSLDTSHLTIPQAQWIGDESLGLPGAKSVQVESDGHGGAVAVWVQAEGEAKNIYSSRYQMLAGWSEPVLIESVSGEASYPRLSMNSSGVAFVVWEQFEAQGPQRLYAARYQQGSWNTAQRLDIQSGANQWQITASDIEINENGHVFAVWCQQDADDRYGLYARRFTATGGWEEQKRLASLVTGTRHIRINMNSSGDAVVAWLRGKATGLYRRGRPIYIDDVYINRYTENGWQIPELLENKEGRPYAPHAGIDDAGNIKVVWTQGDEGTYNLYANSYQLTTGWSGAQLLHHSAERSLMPHFKMNDLGEGVVVWREQNGAYYDLKAKRFSQNVWQEIESLESYDGPIDRAYLDINHNNHYAVGWVQVDAEGEGFYTTHYQAGAGWSNPKRLNLTIGQIVYEDLDIAESGQITAIWMHGERNQLQIHTNRYQAPPAYYGVQASDTWNSIAMLLYGSDTVSDELQMTLGQPGLSVDLRLSSLPETLSNTNTPPNAVDDEALTEQNTAIVLDVLGNDRDVDNDPIVISGLTQPLYGVASVSDDNQTILYTPNSGYSGRDDIRYQVSDNKAGVAEANVAIVVAATDTDIDGDGVLDIHDAFPLDPTESADFDGDGVGDNSDPDQDNDGVDNATDQCPSTPLTEVVDAVGCPVVLFDADADGVTDALDLCPNTPSGEPVDTNGCSATQRDSDNDGVNDALDQCPDTLVGLEVDSNGCPITPGEDSDSDGVADAADLCPGTPAGEAANLDGCSASQLDDDGDGYANSVDRCPNTQAGATPISLNGCSIAQLDLDGDGVYNYADRCADTVQGEAVDEAGCAASQRDSDQDGVSDADDNCPYSHPNEVVSGNGCGPTEFDQDNDGINDAVDNCPEYYNPDQTDTDSDTVGDACDTTGTINITRPQNNEVLTGLHTRVSGTFSSAAGSRIIVNAREACTWGNQFYLNNIPLKEGAHDIAARIVPAVGLGALDQITVTGSEASPFKADIINACNTAPLLVEFEFSLVQSNIQQIEIDYENNGTMDATITDFSAPHEYTYANPGVYTVNVIATDQDNNTHSQLYYIVAEDSGIIDTEIQNCWSNIETGLSGGNATLALNEMTPGAQEKFQPVLEALDADMAAIVSGFSEMRPVRITRNYAEYAINRTINGQNRIFLIYFIKDQNGQWKLDEM